MAILKIARMGHPVLLQVAEPVADPTAPEIQDLLENMAETMLDASGLGLAAPQVYMPLRIFVWRNGDDVAALINPEIELLTPATSGAGKDASRFPACAATWSVPPGSASGAWMPRGGRWKARRKACWPASCNMSSTI